MNGFGLTWRDAFMIAGGAIGGFLVATRLTARKIEKLCFAIFLLMKPR